MRFLGVRKKFRTPFIVAGEPARKWCEKKKGKKTEKVDTPFQVAESFPVQRSGAAAEEQATGKPFLDRKIVHLRRRFFCR